MLSETFSTYYCILLVYFEKHGQHKVPNLVLFNKEISHFSDTNLKGNFLRGSYLIFQEGMGWSHPKRKNLISITDQTC